MPFSADADVVVKAVGDNDWEVMKQLGYDGTLEHFDVPVGASTDFASVPRVFVWFLPQYGRYTRAAILHDFLWRKMVPERLSLAEADGIFRRAMRELGVSFLVRWLMWAAVRLGALKKPGGRKHWVRDSWAVFPLLAVALPIVVPPALVILAALAVFFVLESVLYLPLKIARGLKLRSPKAERVKEVNAPELNWKLG